MKRIALALFAAVGLAATAARADRVTVHGSIHIGSPAYNTPGYHHAPPAYCPPPAPRGYWRDVTVSVWVPGRWIITRDHCGRRVRVWEPPHTEYRTNRVWVDGYARHDHGRGWGRRHWNG